MNASKSGSVRNPASRAMQVSALFATLSSLGFGCAGQEPNVQEPAASEATQPAPVEPMPPATAETTTPAAVVPAEPVSKNIVVKEGLSTPESALYDAEADLYLVSNINGSPFDADDNGFISKISPDGKVAELKWIDGAKDNVKLNAPKGMIISQGILYVTDIDTVRKFDAKTGEPKGDIMIKGASFLNDLVIDADGTLYVSDTSLTPKFESAGGDAVFKIVNGKAKPLIKSKDLKGPNGLLLDDKGLWVVTFGGNEMYNVKSGKKADVKTLPHGQLDGITKTADGTLLVSSWETKQVFAASPSGEWTAIASDVSAPADIGYDSKRNRLLIPLFLDSGLQIQPL